jgi:hypothetical protein
MGQDDGGRDLWLEMRNQMDVGRENGQEVDPPQPRRREQERRQKNGIRRPNDRNARLRESEE